MHPHAQISARYFGRIGSSPHDRADDHSITRDSRTRRDDDAVTNSEMRARSESFVDRDRARLARYW
jgi:hypothetical protein